MVREISLNHLRFQRQRLGRRLWVVHGRECNSEVCLTLVQGGHDVVSVGGGLRRHCMTGVDSEIGHMTEQNRAQERQDPMTSCAGRMAPKQS